MNDSSNTAGWNDDSDELAMLLAGEALGDLDESERSRLKSLQDSTQPQLAARESLRRIADVIGLAAELTRDDLPSVSEGIQVPLDPQLIEKIRRDAADYLPGSRVETSVRTTSNVFASSWLGWCVAASLALVFGGMWLTRSNSSNVAMTAVVTNEAEALEWMRLHPDALELSWTVNDPALVIPVSDGFEMGGVLWDSASQSGYLRLKSLPVNDLMKQQYQLWIIDPQRDEEPVDGGVFDIVQTGESYVPIQAKLDVIEPVGFAVTVEKPGGVVVSDQSRLPLLAMVP